jgi:hypothetical protein
MADPRDNPDFFPDFDEINASTWQDNNGHKLSDSAKAILESAKDNLFDRPVKQEELYYLLSLYPFIVLCNADNAFLSPDEQPTRFRTKNGWIVVEYADAIVMGTNYWEAERYASEHNLKGLGTLSKQALDAMIELVEHIKKKKRWARLEVITGHYPLQRLAWIISTELEFPVIGFSPQPEDEVVRRWFKKIRARVLYPPEYPILTS